MFNPKMYLPFNCDKDFFHNSCIIVVMRSYFIFVKTNNHGVTESQQRQQSHMLPKLNLCNLKIFGSICGSPHFVVVMFVFGTIWFESHLKSHVRPMG